MPQTIYMPPEQKWWQPAVDQTSQFLWNMLGVKMQHKMAMEEQDRALKAKEVAAKQKIEQEKIKRQSELGEKGHVPVEKTKAGPSMAQVKGVPGVWFDPQTQQLYRRPEPKPKTKAALIQQYELAQQQFKEGTGPDPGPFNPWLHERVKTGATRISVGEKLTFHEKKAEITAKVKKESAIQSPNFKSNVAKELSRTDPNYEYLDHVGREEAIFQEMNRKVEEAYPDKNIMYDHVQGGWVDSDSGEMVKTYKLTIFHRKDARR